MKRRKGRIRPPTVGRNCVWLTFEDGVAVCAKKKASNELSLAAGGKKAYARTLCDKTEFCGFEDKDSED